MASNMSAVTQLIMTLDKGLDDILAGWNHYTTALVLGLVSYALFLLFTSADADVHPFLLGRQASASSVRQPGESAVYRSLETPQGYPLRSGLNVKDADAPKWSAGRDGDLRDVWRQALKPLKDGKDGAKETLKITSVLGKKTARYTPKGLMKDMNALGRHLQKGGTQRVAMYLPNSAELLVTLFASVFYGITPVLVPHDQPQEILLEILRETKVDRLVAPAGTIPAESLHKACPSIKEIIWVVEETSRQLDWKSPTHSLAASTWHDVVEAGQETASDSPPEADDVPVPPIVTVETKTSSKAFEVIEYSQANIVAAIAAQGHALPIGHRFEERDRILSLESLCSLYPLIIVLTGLYSSSGIMLSTSVGPSTDFMMQHLTSYDRPSVIIASSETMAKIASDLKSKRGSSLLTRFYDYWNLSTQDTGALLSANHLFKHGSPRLFYVYSPASSDSVPLSATDFAEIRNMTHARTIHVLTAPKVAGAVAQTNIFDYRRDKPFHQRSHFGAPLSSVEVKLVAKGGDLEFRDELPVGRPIISGPAVVGEETTLDVVATIRRDHALALTS